MFPCVKTFGEIFQLIRFYRPVLAVKVLSKTVDTTSKRCLSLSYCQHALKSTRRTTEELKEEEQEEDDCNGEKDPFLRNEIKKFNLGKRWLARMMGEDPDNFTQDDIDAAIQYLLPSHLFAKDARPMLKHPYEIFPRSKESQFDEYGRPFSSAFYTGSPKYYDLTFRVWEVMEILNTEPSVEAKNPSSSGTSTVNDGKLMQWMKKFQLEQKLDENLNDKLYDTIMFRLKKLATHERSGEIQEFLQEYQVPVYTPGKEDLKEVDVYGNAARAMGYRKTAIAEVVVKEGTGMITVNNIPLLDFFHLRNDREQVMYPLLVINNLNRFDIEAHVIGGGTSGKSGAIRLGVSRAIAALRPEYFDALNSANLLIRDRRQKERKKPGRKKARKGFQWVKR